MAMPPAAARAARAARRLAPLALEAYRRWDKLTPEEKERYRQRVREYADRGRHAIEHARARRGGRGTGGPPAGRQDRHGRAGGAAGKREGGQTPPTAGGAPRGR